MARTFDSHALADLALRVNIRLGFIASGYVTTDDHTVYFVRVMRGSLSTFL